MADSRLAKLKEAAKKKKEKAAEEKSPKAAEKPPVPEKKAPEPKREEPKKEVPRPEPKKEAPAPKRYEPAPAVTREKPREAQKPRRAVSEEVEDEVDAAFGEERPSGGPSGAKAKPKFEPVGPVIVPPSFEMDPSKIKRGPSPGKYGKLIDAVRDSEALTTSADVYAVLMACMRRFSEVEGKSKSVKDLVSEESKKYLQSKKKP